MNENNKQPLLEVSDLKTYFFTEDGIVKAVDGVDFEIYPGEVLGVVGESGCGKSVTALSIMQLVGVPGEIIAGNIDFMGENLLEFSQKKMVSIRGNRISMIFQQPKNSLNPVFSIGEQVAEVFEIHHKIEKEEAWQRAVGLLHQVGIPDAEDKAKAYPHEISGGQAQRVMIAMALALNPQLLIADEPTTALDVTIQAQILDLMRGLSEKLNTSVILITHDLGVVAEMAQRVAVMYAGKIVEVADVVNLFKNTQHPYTQGLIASIPSLTEEKEELDVIPGMVPNLINLPPGCAFAPRCYAQQEHDLAICTIKMPNLVETNPGHKVRCWLFADDADSGHQAIIKKKEVIS